MGHELWQNVVESKARISVILSDLHLGNLQWFPLVETMTSFLCVDADLILMALFHIIQRKSPEQNMNLIVIECIPMSFMLFVFCHV